MIGKKEWFVRRTFGWGLTPVTWQDWVYTLGFVAVLILIIHAPAAWFVRPQVRWITEAAWAAILFLDVLHIWLGLKER